MNEPSFVSDPLQNFSSLETVFTNSTFLEIPIRFLGLKNFSERIQSLQVVGIPIGIPRNSGY